MEQRTGERTGQWQGRSTVPPRISIIVPVWNGAKDIPRLLAALDRQTAPRDLFEVLIVDNGSTDDTARLVREYPWITLLSQPKPGSYAARNLALGEARGAFVLFTDADCVPADDWIEVALHLADKHGEDCLIGGRITLFQTQAGGKYSLRYEQHTAFQQEWNLAHSRCVTANWLCARSLLTEVGDFDERLMSGGDGDCSDRIAAAGHRFVYAPELVVGHPTRASIAELAAKKRRVVGGRWSSAKQNASPLQFSAAIAREFTEQARWLKNTQERTIDKLGMIGVVAVMWLATQVEIVRLVLGGKAKRQ